jgi:SAM-dependent methyltransferase
MLKQLAKARWARVPVRIAKRLVPERFRRKEPHGDNPFYLYLRGKYYEFVKVRFPTIDQGQFFATVERNIDPKISGGANKYVADLWDLFEPTYKADFGAFYKWHEKLLFFRFLTYARNEQRILDHYANAYRFAIDRLGKLAILEVGGGVPHGLLYHAHRSGPGFCEKLTYVDIDVLHADFVAWYCAQLPLALRQVRALAARAPEVPDGRYNFVFAKDVFEHLDQPERLLDGLVAHLAPGGLLAVDLEDKGPVMHQHISPNLPPLKDRLRAAGFEQLAQFGVVTIWGARAPN